MGKVVSVVIPARNEAFGIGRMVNTVYGMISDAGFIPEIIIVDDGSTDATFANAAETALQVEGMHVLRLSRNFGKEAAIAAGLFAASGDAAIVMDADFQHPVDTLPAMLQAWSGGADIVEAVKVRRGRETLFSKLSATFFYFLFKFLSRWDISQATDFKLLDRRVLDNWKQLQETHLFFRGMTAWLGFKRTQIPIEVRDRLQGSSRWSTLNLLLYAIKNIISFSPFLLYIAASGILILSVLTMLIAVRGIWVKLNGQVVDGLTIILLTQSIIGTGLMLVMAAICAYLSLIFEELKKRPRFIVAETYPPARLREEHAGDRIYAKS